MKKIILATIIGISGMSNSFAECTYNFDASLQDLKAYEAAKAAQATNHRYVEQVANINNVNQSGYDVIRYYSNKDVDTLLASKKYIQFKTQYPFDTPGNAPLIDKPIASSDIFVQEFIFDVNNLRVNLGNNSQMYEYGFNISGSSESKLEFTLNLMFTKGNNYSGIMDGDSISSFGATYKLDGNGNLAFLSAARTTNPVEVPTDGKVRVGIYVNQNTKQVGYIINGNNYGYLSLTMENKLKYIGFMGVINQDHFANSALTGKTVGLQLVTDKSKMQFTYPTGAKDICGVAL
ncbi:DUF4882 family protein [Acinetobacter nosocomialis]|uniref:DUF4882 family protein n=2 Tax=Acinetobacter calcoaceticus/baumannii complex TaxID=909768 RepID=UPI0026F0ACE0|nr:DUF4882 family protein [Acinetobacter nosocomialis]MDO7229364.1 DUF4882 family protein [Acinetobacter nosocomialis]